MKNYRETSNVVQSEQTTAVGVRDIKVQRKGVLEGRRGSHQSQEASKGKLRGLPQAECGGCGVGGVNSLVKESWRLHAECARS